MEELQEWEEWEELEGIVWQLDEAGQPEDLAGAGRKDSLDSERAGWAGGAGGNLRNAELPRGSENK